MIYFVFVNIYNQYLYCCERFHPFQKFRNKTKRTSTKRNKKEDPSGSGPYRNNSDTTTLKNKRYPYTCLNPDCDEVHQLRDCNITTSEISRKPIDDKKAKKKPKSEPYVSVVNIEE